MKMFGMVVELDALFDTRISRVAKCVPDLTKWVDDNNYTNNGYDYYEIMNTICYKQQKLDDMLIISSFVTPLLDFLNSYLGDLYKNVEKRMVSVSPVLYLNIHPYILSEATQEALATHLSKAIVFDDIPVHIIDEPYKTFTPTYLKKYNISLLAYYHLSDLLVAYTENTDIDITCVNKDIQTIGPRMLVNETENYNEVLSIKNKEEDPFEVTRMLYSVFLDIEWLAPRLFKSALLIPDEEEI